MFVIKIDEKSSLVDGFYTIYYALWSFLTFCATLYIEGRLE